MKTGLPVELFVVLEPLDGVEVPVAAAGALPGIGAPQLRRRPEYEGVGHPHLLDVQLPSVLCKFRKEPSLMGHIGQARFF